MIRFPQFTAAPAGDQAAVHTAAVWTAAVLAGESEQHPAPRAVLSVRDESGTWWHYPAPADVPRRAAFDAARPCDTCGHPILPLRWSLDLDPAQDPTVTWRHVTGRRAHPGCPSVLDPRPAAPSTVSSIGASR